MDKTDWNSIISIVILLAGFLYVGLRYPENYNSFGFGASFGIIIMINISMGFHRRRSQPKQEASK